MPVLLMHGLRGSFADMSLEWPAARPNWTLRVYDAGALPQVERPDLTAADIAAHADGAPGPVPPERRRAEPVGQETPRGL